MANYDVYYDEFKDLWLRDDPVWVSERKNKWQKILSNMETYHRRSLGDKNYLTQLKHYFLYGQHLMYTDKIVRNFIGSRERIICVPWVLERELESVFHYYAHNSYNKNRIV